MPDLEVSLSAGVFGGAETEITKTVNPMKRNSQLLQIFVLAVSFFLAGCSDPEKNKAEHITRGDALLKEQKYQEASLEYRNALQIDANSVPAHWGLAQVNEKLGRIAEMAEELRQVVRLDESHLDSRVKLGNLYLLTRPPMLEDADRLAKEIEAKDPNYPEGLILAGSVLYAQGDKNGALTKLNRAIEVDPKRIESHLSLARFYRQTNDLAKAEETLRKAIQVNPSSGIAHTEYGTLLAGMNRLPEAETELRKGVELDPASRETRQWLATYYWTTRQLDKAEGAYKDLAQLEPNNPESRIILADFYTMIGRAEQAQNVYQEVLAQSPDFQRGYYRLGELMLQRGDLDGAGQQADALLKKSDRDADGLTLRARVRLQKGQTKEAIEDLKEVLKQQPDSRPGLFYMAEANLREGRVEEARVFAGDLERYNPDYLPGKLMQAQISLAAGDAQAALKQSNELLDKAAKTAPDFQTTGPLLAEMRIKGLTARGSAHLMLRRTKEARDDLQTVVNALPSVADPYVNLAAVAASENNLDEARQLYDKALSLDKTNLNALSNSIKLAQRQGNLDGAHAQIDQALAAQPNSAALRYFKAQVFGMQNNSQNAEAELRRALESDPNYLPAYFSLGALYANMNQQDRAIAEYRKVTERQGDNAAAAYAMIGMLEDGRRNYDAAIENYKQALSADPNNVISANNLAWNYAEHGKGNLDEAVRLAQGVVQRYPDYPGFADTLGWVYHKKNLNSAAVEQLRKAVAKQSENPLYRYHLGLALAGMGDKGGARRELEQSLKLGEGKNFAQAEEVRQALTNL